MTFAVKKFDHLLSVQGLSDQLIKNHIALYQGYITNLNKMEEVLFAYLKNGDIASPEYTEIKRRIAWEFNGMRLHELYFENLTKNSAPLKNDSAFTKKIAESFGSPELWEKDFRATGAMRGIGWIIAYYDPLSGRIFNSWITEHDTGHLCGAIPLLVMDVFEHAFMLDYGIKKTDYIDAFFKIIDWDIVIKRYNAANTKK